MKTEKRLYMDDKGIPKNYTIMTATDDRIEQYLVFSLNLVASPGLKALDKLMKKYLFKRFNLQVEDLTEKWESQCWNCIKKSKDLKRCSGCKQALYCSTQCQRAYRKVDKVLDYERRNYDTNNCYIW